jgi:site-specific recombinase XerD
MEGDKEQLEKSLVNLLNKIEKISGEKNSKNVRAWVDFLRACGANIKTILKNMYCISVFAKYMPSSAQYSKATKEEIASAIAKVEGSDYSSRTKQNVKITVKAFYKHFLGEDYYYPKQVAWIKATAKSNKKMLPEDILDEDEVLSMIEAADNARDKAIIALLYDSGIRVGELLSLRKKDVDLNNEIAHVIVNGKTGMRKVPILFSAPYLSNYLEIVRDKELNEHLWTAIGTWKEHNKLVEPAAIRKLLQIAGKRAGIRKRIYPHLFRHSRATYYANKLTEQQLKAFFGWTGDSKMVSTYVHMSGRDIDDAVLQAYGKKPREALAPKLTEKVCPRCRFANGIDFLHCKRCGAPLDARAAVEAVEDEDTTRASVAKMITSDPKLMEKVIQEYLAGQRKKQ